jgi:hypothetical protein
MTIEDERIEQLKRKLYSNSQESDIVSAKKPKLPRHAVLVNESWGDGDGQTADNPVVETDYLSLNKYEKKKSPLKTLLLVSIIVFLSAIIFAGYIIFSGENFISNNNIDIRLIGPVTTPAGEELSLDVDIVNRNRVDLSLADLVVTYPQGTRQSGDRITPLITDRISLYTIKSGETKRVTIKSVMFGEEDVRKNIDIELEYQIPNSRNIFVKKKQYPIFIGSSPLTVNIESLREVIPDQEADFRIKVKSNSASMIRGVMIKVDYPFGFQFINSTPSPSVDQNTWSLGDINPGDEREIVFRGKIVGQENQNRAFRFYTGIEDSGDKTIIGTVFSTETIEIALRKPFLSADIALNGKTADTFVTYAGETIKGEITYQNNINVPLNDVIVELRLEGEILNRGTVSGDRGFYRSIDNTIIWDRNTMSEFREINPGQTGRLQFSFSPVRLTNQNAVSFRDEDIRLSLFVRAKRLNEDNVPVDISSDMNRTVKIATNLTLDPRLVYSVGPFQNTGPIPPAPEQETTYTVIVNAKSSYNTLKDVVYTANLPQYVKWTGKVFPEGSIARYNPDTRQITWNVGEVTAGTGYVSDPKQFMFQVALLPSVTQFDTTPVVLTSQKLTGVDTFTNTVVESDTLILDTKTETDPQYRFGDEKVGATRKAF